MKVLILTHLLLFSSFSLAMSGCVWVESELGEKFLPGLIKTYGLVRDWDTDCKIKKPTMKEMQSCYCSINKDILKTLSLQLSKVYLSNPDWKDKKICYQNKTGNSVNVILSSYDALIKRCK